MKIKSITDVITNSSSEVYLIKRSDYEDILKQLSPEGREDCGSLDNPGKEDFSLENMRNSRKPYNSFGREDIVDFLKKIKKPDEEIIYPNDDPEFWDIRKNYPDLCGWDLRDAIIESWSDGNNDLWRAFVGVNEDLFKRLSEYSMIDGPEDHYSDYVDDWDILRDNSIWYEHD